MFLSEYGQLASTDGKDGRDNLARLLHHASMGACQLQCVGVDPEVLVELASVHILECRIQFLSNSAFTMLQSCITTFGLIRRVHVLLERKLADSARLLRFYPTSSRY